MSDNKEQTIKLIYVIGSGRSGSTLLTRLLGNHSQIVDVGEIYNLKNYFESAEEKTRYCSCGELLNTCVYWKDIKQELKEILDEETPNLKDKYLPHFEKNNFHLFRLILQKTNKTIIVDSSKRFYRLKLLEKSDKFDVLILHLVRDPRAYAYSSLHEKEKIIENKIYIYLSVLKWLRKNLSMKLLLGQKSNYLMVKYEDFVANPDLEIAKVLQKLNLQFEQKTTDLSFRDDSQHIFSGNHKVIAKQEAKISKDIRYIKNLTKSQWFISSVLALIGLITFNYSFYPFHETKK